MLILKDFLIRFVSTTGFGPFMGHLQVIDVTGDLVGNNNITFLIVWFTSQRKVFNLKKAHVRAEICR